MGYVYRYRDKKDGIIKYVGIVWSNNRTLFQRIKEHERDDWYKKSEWYIEYISENITTRTDAEYFEAHYISLYKTDQYYNIKKSGWGVSNYLPERNDWTRINIDILNSIIELKCENNCLKSKIIELKKTLKDKETYENVPTKIDDNKQGFVDIFKQRDLYFYNGCRKNNSQFKNQKSEFNALSMFYVKKGWNQESRIPVKVVLYYIKNDKIKKKATRYFDSINDAGKTFNISYNYIKKSMQTFGKKVFIGIAKNKYLCTDAVNNDFDFYIKVSAVTPINKNKRRIKNERKIM